MPYFVNERCYKTLQEAVSTITEETSAYDVFGNKITTWGAPSQINTRILTYVDFGSPGMPEAKIGTLYFDKHTNKMWMFNSEKKWVHMANYGEHKTIAAKNNKNIINCRNCGAPVRSRVCEYCGSHY